MSREVVLFLLVVANVSLSLVIRASVAGRRRDAVGQKETVKVNGMPDANASQSNETQLDRIERGIESVKDASLSSMRLGISLPQGLQRLFLQGQGLK